MGEDGVAGGEMRQRVKTVPEKQALPVQEGGLEDPEKAKVNQSGNG